MRSLTPKSMTQELAKVVLEPFKSIGNRNLLEYTNEQVPQGLFRLLIRGSPPSQFLHCPNPSVTCGLCHLVVSWYHGPAYCFFVVLSSVPTSDIEVPCNFQQ